MSVTHEAGEVKPGLHWKLQNFGDSKIMGYLPRTATNRRWNQPTRKKHVLQLIQLKEVEDMRSALSSGIEMQSLEFWSWLETVCPHCAPFPLFLEL